MYKRYQGNSGRVERIEERDFPAPPAFVPPPPAPPPPPSAPPRPNGSLTRLLGQFLPDVREPLETEDLLLLLVLYLLYRESGDRELLIVMGAMLFL
ncbi:MAG: hypothetical protein J6P58_07270 [Oscillospiraceae bacterium]|nr:hypothetical protein [Oscillospiraceae bacterium]